MKALVVYDSVYGNTEKIARRIAVGLEDAAEVRAVPVAEVKADDLKGLDLLLVGSPTQAFGMIAGPKAFFKNLPAGAIKGVKVAAFDTRMDTRNVDSKVFTFMAGLFGYAAEKIARALKAGGGVEAAAPGGFIVTGKEGPLKDGELDRAGAWAREIISQM